MQQVRLSWLELNKPTPHKQLPPGSGSATITGAEQSTATQGGTAGSGSASTSGAERTTSGTPATHASGTVTIGGSELSTVTDPCSDQGLIKPCPRTLWDTGTVTINVNGVAKTVSYASASTPTSIGSSFVTAYAGDPTVTVTSSGATITLVSIATGTAANYSLSA